MISRECIPVNGHSPDECKAAANHDFITNSLEIGAQCRQRKVSLSYSLQHEEKQKQQISDVRCWEGKLVTAVAGTAAIRLTYMVCG